MPIDDMLTLALHEHGFELLVAVRVAAPIANKLDAIREVRTLTGCGLRQAKDAVEREEIILDSLTPAQAEWVRRRLAAAGAQSVLSLARAHLYAFVPAPGRSCERLTVVGQTLELAQGQLGTWGAPRALPVDDGELLEAIDRQRASWAAAGFCEAGSEIEILGRMSARDEPSEARIRAAEGEALAHEAAIYGDWLLSKGDARGIVASRALSLAAAADEGERARRADALVEAVSEHAVHLFGPARRLHDSRYMRLEWLGPVISSVEFFGAVGTEFEHTVLLERLLALPVCVGLRRLLLWARLTEHVPLGELLGQSSCAASLRSLWVTNGGRVSMANGKLERLESLELAASDVTLAGLCVPALRRLSVELPNLAVRLVNCLHGLDAPSLEHFAFAVSGNYRDYEGGPLQYGLALALGLPAFARLRTLTLRCGEGAPPWDRGLVELFTGLPACQTLEHIDLRQATLAPEARAELEAARPSLPKLLLD